MFSLMYNGLKEPVVLLGGSYDFLFAIFRGLLRVCRSIATVKLLVALRKQS